MMRILFRADAGTVPEVGTGHMVRSLTFARALRERLPGRNLEVIFATRGDENFTMGRAMAVDAGFECRAEAGLEPNSPSELEALASTRADVVIMDRLATSSELVLGLQEAGSAVWTFDDLGKGRRHADVAINALLQDVEDEPHVHVGYDYLILPSRHAAPRHPRSAVSRVFACFGGFDARGLSPLVLEALGQVAAPLECDLVVGQVTAPTFQRYREVARRLEASVGHVVRLHRGLELSRVMQASDLAIVSGGMTAFETARFGIPAVGLPQYEHQLENLARLQDAECQLGVGCGMEISAAGIAARLDELIGDFGLRARMSRAGRRLIDGAGLDRVANLFEAAVFGSGPTP